MRGIRRPLKACLSLFKIRLAEQLQYRAAALANSTISIFWGILQIVMFTVFFTYGNINSAAMTLPQAVSYAWLVQILLGVTGRLDVNGEIRTKIIDGNVALELCRPLDLYAHWYAKTVADQIGGSFWRMLITLLAALVMPAALRLTAPESLLGFSFFLLSVGSAILLCAAFSMLLSALRVGLTWGDGPTYLLALTGQVLSGAYLPLQLWPDFMQRALLLQPFAGLIDIPVRLYIGTLPPYDALPAIALQLLWAVIFMAAGKVLLGRRISRLIVQGG